MQQKTPIHLSVKSDTRNVTVRYRVGIRMTTNKSVGRSNTPQERATDCGYVGLQAIVSTVGLFANKYIALNHEWNTTGNYAVRMHKSIKILMCPLWGHGPFGPPGYAYDQQDRQ